MSRRVVRTPDRISDPFYINFKRERREGRNRINVKEISRGLFLCVEEEDRGQSNERGVGCLVPGPKNNINMVQYIIYFGKILERSGDRKALCTPSWIPCRCVFGYAIQRYTEEEEDD